MTDNEIVKALECCGDCLCDGCSHKQFDTNCIEQLCHDALDLINRQKAEIERLENENKLLSENADTAFQDGLNEAQDLYAEKIKSETKAEAVKEFAEKLKEKWRVAQVGRLFILHEEIDNLVEKMVGEG